VKWTPTIEEDFRKWLIENRDKLDVPRETIDELLRPAAGTGKSP
jgi:hypothetical protein